MPLNDTLSTCILFLFPYSISRPTPLKEILDVSKLPNPCRRDLEHLLRDYDTTCKSAIQVGREESARRSGCQSARSPARGSLRDASRCKTVGSPVVPNGNYKAAERHKVYATSHRNASCLRASDKEFLQSGDRQMGNATRDKFIKDHANYVHADRLASTVAAHDGSDAHQVYTNAFKSLKGRPPTAKELGQMEHHTHLTSRRPGTSTGRMEASTGQYYYLKKNCIRCGGRLPAVYQKPVCGHCANVVGHRTFQIAPLATTSNSNAPKQL